MSARHRHARRAAGAWVRVKEDWSSAKQLPRSILRAIGLEIKRRKLDFIRQSLDA